ncbi:hypothetical protein BDV18DRAFT_129741 [Aspergillus unguis]
MNMSRLSHKMSNVVAMTRKGSSSSLRSTMSALSVASVKERFASFKRVWGPCLAAKESWEDEYNFPAGRWAGQGLDPRYVLCLVRWDVSNSM